MVSAVGRRLPAHATDRMPEILGRVCDAARRLSRALGYRGEFRGALAVDRERLYEWCRGLSGRTPPVNSGRPEVLRRQGTTVRRFAALARR
jgi:hypothetical protein